MKTRSAAKASMILGTAKLIAKVASKDRSVQTTSGVKTTVINNTHSDNMYNGKYSYKPRKSFSKSKYEKTNCSHGTVLDKDYTPVQSNVAKTALTFLGCRSKMENMAIYEINCIRRRNTGPTVPTLEWSTENHSFMCVVWQKVEITMANRNTHGVTLNIYDLISKITNDVDTTVTTAVGTFQRGHPIAMLQEDVSTYATKNGTASPYLPNYQSYSGVNEIGLKVEACPNFRKAWGICNKTIIDLAPGDQYTHTTFHRKNYVWDRQYFNAVTEGPNVGFIKGITTGTLLQAVGRVGHNVTTSTIDGVNLDTIVKYTTYLREELPYKDYFMFDNTSGWDGEGAARSTINVIEENEPKETGGI